MPVLPPVGEVIRVACRQTMGDDNDVLNIFHLLSLTAGPYDAATLTDVAHITFDAWTSNLQKFSTTDCMAQDATAKDLTSSIGGAATYVPPAPVAGTGLAPAYPANVALVVSWKEFISYRGGHPRTYLGGISSATMTDEQHINGASAAAIQAGANAFIADLIAASWPAGFSSAQLAVVHYRLADAPEAPPLAQRILAAAVNTRLDSQRRRLGK